MIYHITPRADWNAAQTQGVYTTTSLATQGFIHASARDQVTNVANAVFRAVPDSVLLCIDATAIDTLIKWEAPDHPDQGTPPQTAPDERFPHIYGPLPLSAVVRVVDFPLGADGLYTFPADAES